MQSHQEFFYSEGHNYRQSPHLKHWRLYEALCAELRANLHAAAAAGLPRTLLEVGAGEGSFVEPALAHGYTVTATEMSRPALETLTERYGGNPEFHVVFDDDGTLAGIGDTRYSVVLFASVLHDIPDYMRVLQQTLSRNLRPGGTLLTFQDPLWYPGVDKRVRLLGETSFLLWRIGQGNYRRGLKTRLRRLRGQYDESQPSDTVEYHVVRNGVDQESIVDTLRDRFDAVSVWPYWSTQSRPGQWVGERLGVFNTFAIVAREFRF